MHRSRGYWSAHLAALRKSPPKPSRRKLRLFVPANTPRSAIQLSPHRISLQRGKLEFAWSTASEFFSKMMMLCSVAEQPDFEQRYCEPDVPSPKEIAGREESVRIRAVSKYLGKVHSTCEAMTRGLPEVAELLRAEAAAALDVVHRLYAEADFEIDDFLIRAEEKIAAMFSSASAAPPPSPQTTSTEFEPSMMSPISSASSARR